MRLTSKYRKHIPGNTWLPLLTARTIQVRSWPMFARPFCNGPGNNRVIGDSTHRRSCNIHYRDRATRAVLMPCRTSSSYTISIILCRCACSRADYGRPLSRNRRLKHTRCGNQALTLHLTSPKYHCRLRRSEMATRPCPRRLVDRAVSGRAAVRRRDPRRGPRRRPRGDRRRNRTALCRTGRRSGRRRTCRRRSPQA